MNLSTYLPIYLPTYLPSPTYPPTWLASYLPAHLQYLSICACIYQSACFHISMRLNARKRRRAHDAYVHAHFFDFSYMYRHVHTAYLCLNARVCLPKCLLKYAQPYKRIPT